MELLGEALHLTAKGQLIIRCEKLPLVPTQLYDSRRRPVGRLVELFGPWQNPLGRVELEARSQAQRLKGQGLYMEEP